MNGMKRISVIVPVYNVEKYLPGCLDSIMCQSVKPYEVICVNDGSTDGSSMILEEYAQRYPSIKVIEQENGGLSAARNTGIKTATGDYLLFVDSDDELDDDALEVLEQCVDKSTYEIVFFENSMIYEEGMDVNESKNEYYRVKYDYSEMHNGRELFCKKVINADYVESAWLMLIDREWLVLNNFTFCQGALYEDSVFSLQCYFRAQNVIHIKNRLYKYRIRRNSIMTQEHTYRHFFYRLWQVRECLNMIYKEANNDKEIEALSRYTLQCTDSARAVYGRLTDDDKVKVPEIDGIEGLIAEIAHISKSDLDIKEQENHLELIGLAEELKRWNRLIIYGAGIVGKKTYSWIKNNGLENKFIGFAVSDSLNHEMNIRYIGDYSVDDDCVILIAARESYHEIMIKNAKRFGFNNFFRIHFGLEQEIDKALEII